jgi:hypothetical protein
MTPTRQRSPSEFAELPSRSRCTAISLAAAVVLACLTVVVPPGSAQQTEPAPGGAPGEPSGRPPAASLPRDTTQSPRAGAGAGLQIKPPSTKLALLSNRRTSFVVLTDTVPATRLRVVQATLQDGTTHAQLSPQDLKLCVSGRCRESVDLQRGTATRVELAVDPAFDAKGTFAGTVFLASDESSTSLPAFDLTVLSTTRWAQAAGAALILLGILVSLLVTVLLRHRALRLQALLPATRLRDEVRRLQKEVADAAGLAEARFPQMGSRLERILRNLEEGNLEARGYVPGRFAAAVSPAQDVGADYREFLKKTADEVTVVRLVMARGIRPVAERWPLHRRPEIKRALEALDAVGGQAETVDSAAGEVKRIVDQLAQELGESRPETAMDGSVVGPTVQEVRVALQQTNASLWLAWALVTWVAGIVAMVATNYAFGAGLDYYKCFLWGLGIQAAGNQLQQLTPTSVASAFSISLPKG